MKRAASGGIHLTHVTVHFIVSVTTLLHVKKEDQKKKQK
jgi:hypothetical protein